ncbi:MAG: hypothetical protein AAGD28_31085 [Bacteroidota bacterium]
MNEEQQKRINNYLMGKLNTQEMAEFELAMEKDDDLKAAVEVELVSHFALYKSARDQEKEALSQHLTLEKPSNIRFLNSRYLMGIAAAIVLLLLAYFALRPSQQLSPGELYAAYYEKAAAPEQKSAAGSDILYQAHQAYNQAKYSEAIQQYSEYFSQSDTSQASLAHLYKALAHMEAEEISQAQIEFAKIQGNRESADWYNALSLLKENKLAQAKNAFEEIAGDVTHFYQPKASELLSQWPE